MILRNVSSEYLGSITHALRGKTNWANAPGVKASIPALIFLGFGCLVVSWSMQVPIAGSNWWVICFTFQFQLQQTLTGLYRCTVCNSAFKRKDVWKRHVVTVHVGITPHICQVCRRAFKRKDHLRDHLRTHQWHWRSVTRHSLVPHLGCGIHLLQWFRFQYELTADKRYRCVVCSSTFARRDGWKRHVGTVHTRTCHDCCVCGRSFSRRDTLIEHVKMAHVVNLSWCLFTDTGIKYVIDSNHCLSFCCGLWECLLSFMFNKLLYWLKTCWSSEFDGRVCNFWVSMWGETWSLLKVSALPKHLQC